GRGAKRKVSLRVAVPRYRHLHRLLFSVRAAFSPGDDGVAACRDALDLERAVIFTHRIKRVSHHADVSLHPRMLIAFHGNQHFRAPEGFLEWRRAIRLRLVPFLVQLWCRVDVVLCGVAVCNTDFLIDLNAEHVWCVMATVLIELDCRGGRRPAIVANLLAAFDGAFLDVDE